MGNSVSIYPPSPGPEYILGQKCSIEEFIQDYGRMTSEDVAEKYGVSNATVDLYARRLRDSGHHVMSNRPKVPSDEFVDSWNSSESIEEVAVKIGHSGRSPRSLSSMASQYRKKGFELKKFD